MITAVLLGSLGLVSAVSAVHEQRRRKGVADARRRESMRRVTERWHFREWERDLRSTGSR